jgi:hypothetical protein
VVAQNGANAGAAAGASTSPRFDASQPGTVFQLSMLEAPLSNDNEIFYGLLQGPTQTIGFNINQATLFSTTNNGNTFIALGAFDPSTERYLRVTVEAQSIDYEASSDGLNFTVLDVEPNLGGLNPAGFNIGVVSGGVSTQNHFITVDDITLIPPCPTQ